MVAETGTGYILLDQPFLKTRQYRRGHGIALVREGIPRPGRFHFRSS